MSAYSKGFNGDSVLLQSALRFIKLARDISNTGDIVYEILNSSFAHEEGVLFHAGMYYTVDYPGSAATSGFGINDDSVLVGLYQATASGPDQGFKATY